MCVEGVFCDLNDSTSVGCIRLQPAEVLLSLLASLALSCDLLQQIHGGGESANGTTCWLYSMHT